MDRTGSNMITSRLNTHPRIEFYNELFHREYVIFQDKRVSGDPEVVARRDRDPSSFISQVWNGAYEPKEKREQLEAVGFKLFLNHNAEALRYVTNSDSKIVLLRRRNALSRFSSFKIAAQTGKWKATSSKGVKRSLVDFRETEFRAYHQNYLSLETLYEMVLNRWNRPYFSVWYEDFISSSEVWNDLVRFVGFEPNDFGDSPLIKQNSSDILSRFSNPDDVKKFVAKVDRYDWLKE